MVHFDGFDWDSGNSSKCLKHGVSIEEIEALFFGVVTIAPDPEHSSSEERLKAIGRTIEGRAILVAFTLRRDADRLLIRPISARYMHSKEIRSHEEAVARTQNR